MDGWNYWKEKNIYVLLKNKRTYTGYVVDVDDSDQFVNFISIIDKYGNRITFSTSEIEVIQEEEKK